MQVLGFDVLLDSHLSPTLLEVNNHPSMAIDTPVPLDELTEEDESSDLWEYLNKEKDVATTSGAAGKSARNSSLASNSFRQTAASSSSSTCGGDEENNDSESTSSGTPDSLDSQPIVDLCMAAEGSTPSWAKELLHDLRGLTASFVQSSFGTLKAESLSGGSSVEEGESRQSAPLAVCSGSSAASSVLEASLYPSVHARFTPGKPKKPQIRRGADNATQPGAAELQQRSLDTRRIISEMGAPSGLTSTSSGPVHGGRLPEAAKPTPPDLKAKSSMVCPGSKPARTATKKREGNGALPKKPPLHPTKAIAKPKPWGAPCSKSKHDPTAPDVAKPVSVTQATSRALRTPSISPPQARAQGEGQSVRQLRIEASKAVKVCNCKELQTPHRHVVGPVDHYVKFRMLLAVMRIVTSLKIGHDPLDIEEVDQVFEECSPCLGGRDKDGEDEELLDDNGEEMCVSPLLYRLYKMYNSCTTMKGDNSSSRIRHVQPFKLRRWALNSSLLAPCGALKAVDVDILYRQWAMQENETVTAECGGYVSFLDLLFQLAERGLPDTPLGPALWQLLNINSTHGRIKTSKTA